MSALDYIRVVLVEPTHAGNVGAVARAMANMGVSDLRLVSPKDFPSAVASARAAGADHILENTAVCDCLFDAVDDCSLVIGTTARQRSIQWPQKSLENAMQLVSWQARAAKVALVFGRESRGLTNKELEMCNYLVRIPTDDGFSSLNLASAVLILLHELRKFVSKDDKSDVFDDQIDELRASSSEMAHFYDHLFKVLTKLEFSKGSTANLHRKLHRLFNRAWPTAQEIRMLRGILTAVDKALGDPGNDS